MDYIWSTSFFWAADYGLATAPCPTPPTRADPAAMAPSDYISDKRLDTSSYEIVYE